MSSFGNSLKYRREFTLVLLEYVEVTQNTLLSSWNSVKSQRILFFVLQEPLEVSKNTCLSFENSSKSQRISFLPAGTAWSHKEFPSFIQEELEVLGNVLLWCRHSLKSKRMHPCSAGKAWRQRDVFSSSWNSVKYPLGQLEVRDTASSPSGTSWRPRDFISRLQEQLEVSERHHPFVREGRDVILSMTLRSGTPWRTRDPIASFGNTWKSCALELFVRERCEVRETPSLRSGRLGSHALYDSSLWKAWKSSSLTLHSRRGGRRRDPISPFWNSLKSTTTSSQTPTRVRGHSGGPKTPEFCPPRMHAMPI